MELYLSLQAMEGMEGMEVARWAPYRIRFGVGVLRSWRRAWLRAGLQARLEAR